MYFKTSDTYNFTSESFIPGTTFIITTGLTNTIVKGKILK